MTLLDYKKSIFSAFLIIFACLGFGRFAFGMVLPDMQQSLAISTTQIGVISSANFIGYFLGIFLVTPLYNRFETYKLIIITLILQGLAMFAMTLIMHYIAISIFYFLSGALAAVVNMSIMAYMANVIPKEIRGKALGIVVSGSGLAIITSGLVVPYIEALFMVMPWKISWMIFSTLVLVVSLLALPGLKKHTKHEMSDEKTKSLSYFSDLKFWKIATVYSIFGFTYVVYVTFFVKAVMDKYTMSSDVSSSFWIILGFMSIFSGFIFGMIADRIGAFKALSIVFIFQAFAHSFLTYDASLSLIWLSAILFGATVWSVPSLVTLLSSIHFDVKKTAQVLSLLTLLFASSQAIAPIVAGLIKDLTASFDTVFILTSLLCLFASISSYLFSKQGVSKG